MDRQSLVSRKQIHLKIYINYDYLKTYIQNIIYMEKINRNSGKLLVNGKVLNLETLEYSDVSHDEAQNYS